MRFIWFDYVFSDQKIVVYRFVRVKFGITSSPFLLGGTIKCHLWTFVVANIDVDVNLYNLRRNNTFERHQVHSAYYGTESLSLLGTKIWDLVPFELKQLESLQIENKEMDSL